MTNRLLKEALYPYRENTIIGVKIGARRKQADGWLIYSRRDKLRDSVENSLSKLGLETLSVVH